MAPTHPAPSDATVPGTRRHAWPRVAVAGVGAWGRNLVRNFAELGVLTAICEPDATAREAIAARHPGVRLHADWRALLDDAEVEAVAIATPSPTHARLAEEALDSGRAVFVEKPMATTLEEAARLRAAVARSGQVLMVGHLLLYHPAFRALQAFIAAGELGALRYVYSHRLNVRAARAEGSALWDFAPHDISMLLALLGRLPERVTTSASAVYPEVADSSLSHLVFPGDLHAHMLVSWVHPFKDQRLVVIGEAGMAVFDDVLPAARKLAFYPRTPRWRGARPVVAPGDERPIAYPAAEPLAQECRHFLDCVARGTPPASDITEATAVLRVLVACQQAMERGEPVAPDAV